MKIIVCTKFIQGELNPFDAAALECALEYAEKKGAESTQFQNASGADVEGIAEIFVLGMGPASWMEPMRRLTQLGKGVKVQAILLSDSDFAGSDTLATSRTLAAAVRKIEEANGPADLIFCGRQTIDGDTAQVGPELAALLGRTLAANCLELPESPFAQDRKTFDGSETLELLTRSGLENANLPAVLTFERIRELRFPSLRSRPGEVQVWNRQMLGLAAELCGTAGSPTRVLKTFTAEHGRRKCQWITPKELFPLVKELRGKPKLGLEVPESSIRLPRIYAVGREVEPQARAIADEVVFLEKSEPRMLAEALREAEAVLWNADFWGRKTAPQTAALLGTGLCADCTALETDGETLFFYRPARSGDILAKIECRTRPQMATVRTAGASADVIVSGGRGAVEYWNELRVLAEKMNAELCASRALVDAGAAPYECQVGLTGRSVSPKIYVAVGISGAVQHTCAIENADAVLAVNPDRNARIFEFADFGICCGGAELLRELEI